MAPIKVFTNDGQEIKNDLTSATFYFWNKGKEPIRKNDLLKNIILEIGRNQKIIDFKILKKSREVCDIKLKKISEEKINITFDILEQNDGFTGQIIYEGNKDTNLQLKTEIVGVKSISNFAISKYQLLGKTLINIGIGILAILAFLVVAIITSSASAVDTSPDYVLMKNSKKYSQDKEFKEKVDELEASINQTQNIRQGIYTDSDSKKKKTVKKRTWIRIGVFIGIVIVLIALYYAWITAKNEIVENPKQYIPKSIKPNE